MHNFIQYRQKCKSLLYNYSLVERDDANKYMFTLYSTDRRNKSQS